MNIVEEYRFFGIMDSGDILLFNTDSCEKCGTKTLAPNSAIVEESKATLLHLGFAENIIPSEELVYNDDFEGCTCESCCN